MDSLTVAEGRIRPVCGTQPVKGLLFLHPVFPVGWGRREGAVETPLSGWIVFGRYPAVTREFIGDSGMNNRKMYMAIPHLPFYLCRGFCRGTERVLSGRSRFGQS